MIINNYVGYTNNLRKWLKEHGLSTTLVPQITTTGTYHNYAVLAQSRKKVAADKTDSGSSIETQSEAFRNHTTTADDGFLTTLSGINPSYGHLNSDPAASPQTLGAYGLRIDPYGRSGRIDTAYDLYIAPTPTDRDETNITNHYGGCQNNLRAKNHFNENTDIGETNPSPKLHIAGNARITAAIYDPNNEPGTARQVLSTTATEFVITDAGTLGIEVTSVNASATLEVNENVYAAEIYLTSDARYTTNIQELTDANGYKSIDYIKLTPLRIEAIQSQQEQLNAQEARLMRIEKQLGINNVL